jgi:hypothetical protein
MTETLSKLIRDFAGPQATIVGDGAEPGSLGGAAFYASFPPFTAAADILRSADSEFIGLSYALSLASFDRATRLCQGLGGRLIAVRRFGDAEAMPGYAAQYGHDLFVEVVWGRAEPTEIVPAQLCEDAWLYQLGEQSREEVLREWTLAEEAVPRMLGVWVSDFDQLLATYGLRPPGIWRLPVNVTCAGPPHN